MIKRHQHRRPWQLCDEGDGKFSIISADSYYVLEAVTCTPKELLEYIVKCANEAKDPAPYSR